jgi:hypothetical protein
MVRTDGAFRCPLGWRFAFLEDVRELEEDEEGSRYGEALTG